MNCNSLLALVLDSGVSIGLMYSLIALGLC